MAVNLSPVGGVAAQFFDNSGNVLTGGKLYTYAAGTTTPQITYTTNAGNIAWSNPIILDAAGRVSGSGEIWLNDGVQYKFILRDSNDVLIATYDNITGINSNFVNFTNSQEIQVATAGQTVFNLNTMQYQPGTNSLTVFVDGVNQYGPGAQYAYLETDANTVTFVNGLHVGAQVKFTTSQLNSGGAVDAQQVTYTPPFTNSVSTNVELKLSEFVSVKDFGAVGDGVTDDTNAFNLALAAGLADQQAIYIPSGDYKITAGLNQINDSMSIFGDGRGITKIFFAPTVPGEILFDIYKAGPGVLDRFSLGGFSVFGQSANQLTYLRIDNISGGNFYELEFNGGGNSATNSIGMDLKGREACNFNGTYLFNMGQPIVVNPGVSGGIDHFNFNDLYITVSANPPLYPLFKVNSGAVMSNCSFTGFQAWVGGLGAFDHSGTSGINLAFYGLRFETAGVVVADANIVPTFKFNPSASITGIMFNNCYVSAIQPVSVGVTKTTDFYFRNCSHINIQNTSVSHAASGQIANWIDADNTCNYINVVNLLDTPGGHGYEVIGSDLVDVCSTKGIDTGPPTARPNRVLVKKTAVTGISPYPAQQLGDSYFYSKVVSLADGQKIELAGFYNTICQYSVVFSDLATPESVVGGGQFMVSGPASAGTPNTGAVKISGTANMIAGLPSSGQVGLYKSAASPQTVYVENNANVTLTVSITVTYSKA